MSRGPYPMFLMLAMSLPGAARALGLGEIRVDSGLNEPLSAQIDIVGASRDELAALTARVANREVFQRHAADRPAFLASATFKVGMDAQGRPVLNIRSSEAFTDPLVSFLVDLRWGSGELIREYSLLLDPPGFAPAGRLAAAVKDSAPALAPALAAPPGAQVREAMAASGVSAASTPASVTPRIGVSAGHHRVAARDTLRGIARRSGAATESQAQRLMIAIFRANPHAFEGNINRLHSGADLVIPSEQEVAAIDATDARREVRAQMTAWRLEGRPDAPRRAPASAVAAGVVAAAGTANGRSSPAESVMHVPSAARAPSADTEDLKGRVQSLEQALDDMHRQLASESAKLQAMNQGVVHPTTTATVAVPSAAVTPPAAMAPSAAGAPPSVTAPVAAGGAAAPVAAHSGVRVQVMDSVRPPEPILASVAPSPAGPANGGSSLLAPLAIGLGLLVGGVALLRKRLLPAAPRLSDVAVLEPDAAPPSAAAIPPAVMAVAAAPARLPAQVKAEPPVPGPEKSKAAAFAAPPAIEVKETPPKVDSDDTTQDLAIDVEALERSYLEYGVDELGIDANSVETTVLAGGSEDTAAHEMSGMATIAVDTSEIDSLVAKPDFNTVIMEVTQIEPAAINSTVLDYDLLDLDTTAQHVELSADLSGQRATTERRTHIVDVLKAAIERDPERRDLRMKLLETYYSAASTNQRAFLEVVRKFTRERDALSAEDWKKISKMGREIAAQDILFADDAPKDDGLAHCA